MVWLRKYIVFTVIQVSCFAKYVTMERTVEPLVDTHVHFWELKRFPYAWPTADGETLIYRDICPAEYAKEAKIRDTPIRNAIFVQVISKNFPENEWLFDLAKTHPWIVGVVGWVDMTDPEAEAILIKASQNPLFLGIRHVLDFENQDWLGREDVQHTLGVLERLGLTYDLLLRPPILHWAADLAQKFPKLRFIIDHIAKPKPYMTDQEKEEWRTDITKAAQYPNVFCKLSGLMPEGQDLDIVTRTRSDMKPFVEYCVKQFGANRCMFGSDFPVYKLAGATFNEVYQLLEECLADCTTPEERKGIMGKNAAEIYKITVPLNS